MAGDIVIIGGGIIGSATAYYLTHHASLAESKVTLLESSCIAAGSSGKAGGLVSRDMHSREMKSLGEYSYRTHQDLAKAHDGANVWGYRPVQTFELEADFVRAHSKKQASLNSALKWLDPSVTTRCSIISDEESTLQVHPQLLTKELVRLASLKDLTVTIGTAVGITRQEGGSPVSVSYQTSGRTDTQSIPANRVVLAAGPWTGRLAQSLLTEKEARKCIVSGSRAHSVVLEAADLPAIVLFTEIKSSKGTVDPEIYCRPDGSAYICGPIDGSDLPETADKVEVDSAAVQLLHDQARRLSPSFQNATIRAEQSCYLPNAERGLPIIGEIREGIWIGSGHSCWGISNGPGTGKLLADLMLGSSPEINISNLSP